MNVPVTSATTIETASWDIIGNKDFNRMKRINLIVQNVILEICIISTAYQAWNASICVCSDKTNVILGFQVFLRKEDIHVLHHCWILKHVVIKYMKYGFRFTCVVPIQRIFKYIHGSFRLGELSVHEYVNCFLFRMLGLYFVVNDNI